MPYTHYTTSGVWQEQPVLDRNEYAYISRYMRAQTGSEYRGTAYSTTSLPSSHSRHVSQVTGATSNGYRAYIPPAEHEARRHHTSPNRRSEGRARQQGAAPASVTASPSHNRNDSGVAFAAYPGKPVYEPVPEHEPHARDTSSGHGVYTLQNAPPPRSTGQYIHHDIEGDAHPRVTEPRNAYCGWIQPPGFSSRTHQQSSVGTSEHSSPDPPQQPSSPHPDSHEPTHTRAITPDRDHDPHRKIQVYHVPTNRPGAISIRHHPDFYLPVDLAAYRQFSPLPGDDVKWEIVGGIPDNADGGSSAGSQSSSSANTRTEKSTWRGEWPGKNVDPSPENCDAACWRGVFPGPQPGPDRTFVWHVKKLFGIAETGY